MLPDLAVSTPVSDPAGVPERWGIMEACRRISAVRSVADARSRALRERPLPRRDPAEGEPKRGAVKTIEVEHREEMQ
jgi:hypothetical protein